MHYAVNEHYNTMVVHVSGKILGSIDGPKLLQIVDDLTREDRTNIVIDLSETRFMDSTAIGTLIEAKDRVKQAGGDVRLAGMQKRIRGLFATTRLLGPVFTNYEEVEDAVQSFSAPEPEDEPTPPQA